MKRLLPFLLIALIPLLISAVIVVNGPTVNPAAGGSFSPSDLASLKRWIKADALGGGLSDGDSISTATDASGNGNDLTQTGSLRPVFKTSITKGLPGMLFDHSSGQLMVGNCVNPSASAKSWAIVYQPVSITSVEVELFGTYVGNSYYRYSGDGNGYFAPFRGARINAHPTSVPTSGVHIITGVSTGAAWEVSIDGVSQGAQSASFYAGAAGATFIFGANAASLNPWNGYIFEYCEFDGDIGSTDLANLYNYCAARWQ